MYLTYKDCRLTLDGIEYYASNVAISLRSSIRPVYGLGDRYNIGARAYAADNGVNGELSFSYYLTGADPLRNKFSEDDENPISGNFGGAFFKSGYLRSYQINAKPHGVAEVSASITFYDNLSANLSGTSVDFPQQLAPDNLNVLSFSDMVIGLTGGFSNSTMESIQSISFGYQADIKASYKQDETIPQRVVIGEKTANSTVVTNNLTGTMPITGEHVDITMYLNHPSGTSQETYRIKGRITDKTINADTNGFITNTFKIIQHNLEDEPQINSLQYTDYLTDPIYHRDVLYVYGRALAGVHTILFDGRTISKFTGTDSRLVFILPKRTVSGPVILKGKGGKVQSQTLVVADPGIKNKKDINSAGQTVAEA
jgi:hypothetical protein